MEEAKVVTHEDQAEMDIRADGQAAQLATEIGARGGKARHDGGVGEIVLAHVGRAVHDVPEDGDIVGDAGPHPPHSGLGPEQGLDQGLLGQVGRQGRGEDREDWIGGTGTHIREGDQAWIGGCEGAGKAGPGFSLMPLLAGARGGKNARGRPLGIGGVWSSDDVQTRIHQAGGLVRVRDGGKHLQIARPDGALGLGGNEGAQVNLVRKAQAGEGNHRRRNLIDGTGDDIDDGVHGSGEGVHTGGIEEHDIKIGVVVGGSRFIQRGCLVPNGERVMPVARIPVERGAEQVRLAASGVERGARDAHGHGHGADFPLLGKRRPAVRDVEGRHRGHRVAGGAGGAHVGR